MGVELQLLALGDLCTVTRAITLLLTTHVCINVRFTFLLGCNARFLFQPHIFLDKFQTHTTPVKPFSFSCTKSTGDR